MKPKNPTEIEAMREGGRKLAAILDKLSKQVQPGVSGKDLSAMAAKEMQSAGLQPVLLGYEGFSDVMCVSINDGIVHGLPRSKKFKDGDVVKLDLTAAWQSMVVDTATTVVVGDKELSGDVKRLIEGTKKALDRGISAISGDGTRVGDIAAAVQDELSRHNLGIIRDLVGHGVGYGVHEDPNIPNYGVAATGPVLHAGATIAIEPMATLGDWQISILKDKWTVVSRDGSLTAHFEHTVLITEDGAEILTSL